MTTIKSIDIEAIKPFSQKLVVPDAQSHKGQNGKLLIVGGSQLFHAASIWAAEIASHFVDMVHYCSTDENNEIMGHLKGVFRNGIVVSRSKLEDYAREDDAILIGPGLVREGDEAAVTRDVTERVLTKFGNKRIILDAGALQMMRTEWLTSVTETPILTPHQLEFERLFGVNVSNLPLEEKVKVVEKTAKEHKIVILMKAIDDVISDGNTTIVVSGGNAGLTKGGTGDILAGLVAALRTKHDPITCCVLGSYVIKRTADALFTHKGTWYNNSDIIGTIPDVMSTLV